jgi:hypothetical protein
MSFKVCRHGWLPDLPDHRDQPYSWGAGWGVKGYFTLPYACVTDASLAGDFWIIRIVQ